MPNTLLRTGVNPPHLPAHNPHAGLADPENRDVDQRLREELRQLAATNQEILTSMRAEKGPRADDIGELERLRAENAELRQELEALLAAGGGAGEGAWA